MSEVSVMIATASVNWGAGLQRIFGGVCGYAGCCHTGGVGTCGVVMRRFGGVDGVSNGGCRSWVCGIG